MSQKVSLKTATQSFVAVFQLRRRCRTWQSIGLSVLAISPKMPPSPGCCPGFTSKSQFLLLEGKTREVDVYRFEGWNRWELALLGLLVIAGSAVFIKMVFAPSGEDWEAFKQAHHCQSLAKVQGSDLAGWYCDDGKVHQPWRNQQ